MRCPRFGDRQVCPSRGHRPQKGEDGKATGTPTELIDAMKTCALCPDLFASVGEVAGPSFSQGHLNRRAPPGAARKRFAQGRAWPLAGSSQRPGFGSPLQCTTRAHNSVHRHFMGGRRQKLDHAFPRKPVGYAEKCHGQSSGIAVNNRLSALRAICS